MISLCHVKKETVYVRIDGHMFEIPPNEIFEVTEVRGNDHNNNGSFEYIIPEKLVAQLIMARKPFIVQVPMTKTKGGVTSDMKAALEAAHTASELYDDSQLAKYIDDQQQRVMMDNKPPLAPSAPIVAILQNRGLDLEKDFNLKVPGLTVSKFRDRDAEIDTLKQQLADLMAALGEAKKSK